MNQITQFFQKLMDVSDWPPRWICGIWSEFHGWLYIGSDLTIWLAYFLIPIILLWFIQKKPSIPFLPIFWLFGAFILLCGLTHLIDAVIFWWPNYRLSALIRFATAVVSMGTVFALIKELPKVLNLNESNTSEEISNTNLIEQLAKKQEQIDTLQEEIKQLKGK